MKITKREDGNFEIIVDKDQLQDLYDVVDKEMETIEPNGSHYAQTIVEFDIDAFEALSE